MAARIKRTVRTTTDLGIAYREPERVGRFLFL